MRFLGRWRRVGDRPSEEPVVLRPASVSLTAATAARLVSDIAAADGDVVIDLSGIREWDSDGAAMLVELSESSGRVRVCGLAEATGHMLGIDQLDAPAAPPAAPPGERPAATVTRLRATVVFRPDDATVLADRLEVLIEDAGGDPSVEMLVVDLAAVGRLDWAAIDGIAFASSLAALRGLRLLLVNVPADDVPALRGVGLSGQTWVSPPPLD